MADLNDIAVFQQAAAFGSFTLAAKTLGLPKSSISRAIARLENELGVRLFERGPRAVRLTAIGEAFRARCEVGLMQIKEAVDSASSQATALRGRLRISAGIGFGLNVLGAQLPGFLARYPQITVSIDLNSQPADLVADGVDVAIRMGPLSDSTLSATRLGQMGRYLCAATSYLERHGQPRCLQDLRHHDAIEMPSPNNRPRLWSFVRQGETRTVEIQPRISSNEALLIARLIEAGAGIGILSGYLCAQGIESGTLALLVPEWTSPPVDVSLVFPSRRKLPSPVRAFIDYLREQNGPEVFWKREPARVGSLLRARTPRRSDVR